MENLLIIIVLITSFIQSIAGVGILVLGTPLLLFFNYNIIDAMFFLLPVSIISSLSNILIIKVIFNLKKRIDFKLFKYFFIFCLPSICFGLWFIKNYQNLLNINLLVATIIFTSIFIKTKMRKSYQIGKGLKKFITLIIGLIHGLTNSGGTLLTLFFFKKEDKLSETSRLEIHLFYVLLASTQYAFLSTLKNPEFIFDIGKLLVVAVVILSTFIGNFFATRLKNLTHFLISILAILSGLALIFKNFFSA